MKKIIVPIIFALVGTSFVTYSFLDTFIIPKNVKAVSFSFNNSNNSLPAIIPVVKPGSSSSSQSGGNSSQNSNSSSNGTNVSSEDSNLPDPTSQYYENLTEEQIAALFTPTIEFREREHYSDPDIYIDISKLRDEEDTTTYYVADIRIKSMSYFRTALAKDKFGQNVNERTSDICLRNKGILAIDGDTYGSQEGGYVIRNGVSLRSAKNLDRMRGTTKKAEDLLVFPNGTFSIIDENEVSFEQVEAQNPWQVFSFGPGLVKNGEVAVNENEEVGTAMGGNRNQRCAIGIIAPGHYVFVVNDARMESSYGFSLFTVANIMKDLHCETAYNLDGGGSATMYLDNGTGNADKLGHLVNYPHQSTSSTWGNPRMQQREVSDIVYIGKN